MRTQLLLAFAAASLAACGGGNAPQTITQLQQNSTPTGTVEGRVVDAATGMPVAGATLTTFSGGAVQVTSDATGRYQFTNLPAGTYTVFVEATDFVRRLISIGLAGAAGQYPVGNVVVTQDIDLAKGDATVKGLVLTSNTTPAAGATVYVDLRSTGYDVVQSTKTGADGKFTLTGLPGAAAGLNVVVRVAPYDENMDGQPDYTSSARSMALFPGFTTTDTITLSAVGLQLVQSNVADGEVLPTENVKLTFSQKLKQTATQVTMQRYQTGQRIATAQTYDAAGTSLEIAPVGGPWLDGTQYYVTVSLRSESGASTNFTALFTARAGAAPALALVTNLKTSVTMFDSITTSVPLTWDAVTGAAGYRVYGKDSSTQPSYAVLVSSTSATSASVSISGFDRYPNDALTTPGAAGNKITLAVVPLDPSGNEGTLMGVQTIEVVDTTPPAGTAQQLSGTLNNTAGTSAITSTVRVTYQELITTVPAATFTGGCSATSVLNSTPYYVTFTVTANAGVDCRGAASFNGAKDTNGLAQTVAATATMF